MTLDSNKDVTNEKAAWMMVLTETNRYVLGAITLAHEMRRLETAYPIVALCTQDVSIPARHLLEQSGVTVRMINPIKPGAKMNLVNDRLATTWTKLAAWDEHGYERVVLIDTDMLPLHNMDELMQLDLPQNMIAASYACICNPEKHANYPPNWVPERCAYTHHKSSVPSTVPDYFNSGLVVLRPNRQKFQELYQQLEAKPDVSRYLFADQDFLNDAYTGQWKHLPYTYNALKTLAICHPDMWSLSDIKNIHYIIEKPWQDSPSPRYQQVNDLWTRAFRGATSGVDLSCIP